jgi:hypothetical protein
MRIVDVQNVFLLFHLICFAAFIYEQGFPMNRLYADVPEDISLDDTM